MQECPSTGTSETGDWLRKQRSRNGGNLDRQKHFVLKPQSVQDRKFLNSPEAACFPGHCSPGRETRSLHFSTGPPRAHSGGLGSRASLPGCPSVKGSDAAGWGRGSSGSLRAHPLVTDCRVILPPCPLQRTCLGGGFLQHREPSASPVLTPRGCARESSAVGPVLFLVPKDRNSVANLELDFSPVYKAPWRCIPMAMGFLEIWYMRPLLIRTQNTRIPFPQNFRVC